MRQCLFIILLFAGLLLFLPLRAADDPTLWVEQPLAPDVNGTNPVPSPDGSKIAFVRLAWGRPGGSGGFGSSNLITDVMVMDAAGKVLNEKPLADYYLMSWTNDAKNLVCFRDWEYVLVGMDGTKTEVVPQTGNDSNLKSLHCEYLPKTKEFIWVKSIVAESKTDPDGTTRTRFSGCQIESKSSVLAKSENMLGYLAPSPTEKYIAAFRDRGMYPVKLMRVYDVEKKSWTEFGAITPQPSMGWADAWTPWFPDGSKLLIAQGHEVWVCSPDNQERKSIAKMDATTGLPVVSPSGKSVAFVTWSGTAQPNPGTTIWVVSLEDNGAPQAIVKRFKAHTAGLKWLNDDQLVFDRWMSGERGEAPTSRIFKITRPKK